MALTPLRWIGALVLLCFIGATLVLRPRERRAREGQPRDELAVAARNARSETVRAVDALRILQIVDSVSRTPAWNARAAVDWTMMDASMPPRVAADLRSLADRAGNFRPDSARHRVALVMVADRGTNVQGIAAWSSLDASYVLPADSASPCVVVLRVDPKLRSIRPEWWSRVLNNEWHPQALLGPCGFYEWFGMPGRSVADWVSRHAGVARVSAWQHEPEPWVPPEWYGDGPWGHEWLLRAYIDTDGWRCITGDRESCLRISLDPTTGGRASGEGNVLPDDGFRLALRSLRQEALGPRADSYLAAMAHDLGTGRFQRFWSSNLPLDEAFAQATGEGLGVWTARWANRMYGDRARGPGLATPGALLGFLIAGAALGVAFRVRKRQQVS